MINPIEIETILSKRKKLDPNDEYNISKCWRELSDVLSYNISDTILFLEKDCTEDQFSWISEVFDDIAMNTKSKQFVEILPKILANRFPNLSNEPSVFYGIKYAKAAIGLDI